MCVCVCIQACTYICILPHIWQSEDILGVALFIYHVESRDQILRDPPSTASLFLVFRDIYAFKDKLAMFITAMEAAH